jgi:8-oxo-dGTP pyrophosphatase MutT (NUDIX family)
MIRFSSVRIINDLNFYYLVVYQTERRIEDREENMLDFTKGKADEGETDIDCAVREISEEVGLDVRKYISEDHFIKVETI